MKNCPIVFNVDEFQEWNHQKQVAPNQWERARPIGLQGLFLFHRLRIAWRVFKGDWDAVKWVDQ